MWFLFKKTSRVWAGMGCHVNWNLRKHVQTKQRCHMRRHKHTWCEVVLQMRSFKSGQDRNNKAIISRAFVFCCRIVPGWCDYTWRPIGSPPPTDTPLCAGGGRAHSTGHTIPAVPQYLRGHGWPLRDFQVSQDSQGTLATDNSKYNCDKQPFSWVIVLTPLRVLSVNNLSPPPCVGAEQCHGQ